MFQSVVRKIELFVRANLAKKNAMMPYFHCMGNNKNPGNDGLSKEFYVCFFNEILPFLIEALNFSFQHGELSISQRQAVITLIEKKGKDKRCDQFHL